MLKNCLSPFKLVKLRVIDKMEQNSHMRKHPNTVTINFMNALSIFVFTK